MANILTDLLNVVGPRLDESWRVKLFHVAAPVGSVVCLTLGQDREDGGDWLWVIGGVLLLIATGAIDLLRERYRARSRQLGIDAADALRVALKDALQPVAEMLSEMQSMTTVRSKGHLKHVADQCCQGLKLLLKDVHLRAVVYQIDDRRASTRTMSKLAVQGRSRSGPPPQPFVEGTARGDAAFETVDSLVPCFVEDVDDAAEVAAMDGAYYGTRNGYKTFIAAVITDGTTQYGMVTVDAPVKGDLLKSDQELVMLLADLMAVAFAAADG